MSEYGNFMGGALNFKSDGPPSVEEQERQKYKKDKKDKKQKKKEKKQRKKDKKSSEGKKESKKRQRREVERESSSGSESEDSHSGKKARHDAKASAKADSDEEGLEGLTPAQRKFELSRRKREKQHINKMLAKTHRQKIDEFNDKLSKLTEHHDMPKISGAGNG